MIPGTDDESFAQWQKTQPLYQRLNPCDIARYDWLAPVGDLAAKLIPPCPCCAGFRLLAALAVGIALGYWM